MSPERNYLRSGMRGKANLSCQQEIPKPFQSPCNSPRPLFPRNFITRLRTVDHSTLSQFSKKVHAGDLVTCPEDHIYFLEIIGGPTGGTSHCSKANNSRIGIGTTL